MGKAGTNKALISFLKQIIANSQPCKNWVKECMVNAKGLFVAIVWPT